MVTEGQVRDALRAVRHPELGRSLVDLDLVGEVVVDGGRVVVEVGSPWEGLPSDADLVREVEEAVRSIDSVESAAVELVPLEDDQQDALRHRLHSAAPLGDPGSPTRVLGVSSGKGGVGKSSVTVNLAVALARRDLAVGLLDADVYGFSVPKMLGVDRPPLLVDHLVVPPEVHGVRCISLGLLGVGDDQPVIWRGPMLHKTLEQFLTDVYWGEPDFLLVDMPPGTGDVALSMAQFLPRSEVLVVTTPQPAAQRVAQRSALMAGKVKLSVAGVIENMSWFTGDDGKRYEIFGSGGGDALAASLGVPLLGRVPLVPALREGGDHGVPVAVSDPDSEAAQAFSAIADRLVHLAPKRIYHRELKVL